MHEPLKQFSNKISIYRIYQSLQYESNERMNKIINYIKNNKTILWLVISAYLMLAVYQNMGSNAYAFILWSRLTWASKTSWFQGCFVQMELSIDIHKYQLGQSLNSYAFITLRINMKYAIQSLI